jgi:hypothetical protein
VAIYGGTGDKLCLARIFDRDSNRVVRIPKMAPKFNIILSIMPNTTQLR